MNANRVRMMWKVLFAVYVLLLLWFVVVKPVGLTSGMESIRWNRSIGIWNFNLEPFRTISSYLRNQSSSISLRNLLGNIAAFIPSGFLVPVVFRRHESMIRTLWICLIAILGAEILQFAAMPGYFDVDDILLNMTGCLPGYGIYSGWRRLYA
jgi:glycopeptide antibiotics resistance protein